MITGVHIPHDTELPVRSDRLSGLSDYQTAVGGTIEAIDIEPPAVSFFVNDEAKLIGLPVNDRAILLWWLLSPWTQSRDVICGNAVLVGQPDRHGETQDVPAEFGILLFATPTYKVEVQTYGDDPSWNTNGLRFDDYFTAAAKAIDLRQRWSLVQTVRVVAG